MHIMDMRVHVRMHGIRTEDFTCSAAAAAVVVVIIVVTRSLLLYNVKSSQHQQYTELRTISRGFIVCVFFPYFPPFHYRTYSVRVTH